MVRSSASNFSVFYTMTKTSLKEQRELPFYNNYHFSIWILYQSSYQSRKNSCVSEHLSRAGARGRMNWMMNYVWSCRKTNPNTVLLRKFLYVLPSYSPYTSPSLCLSYLSSSFSNFISVCLSFKPLGQAAVAHHPSFYKMKSFLSGCVFLYSNNTICLIDSKLGRCVADDLRMWLLCF